MLIVVTPESSEYLALSALESDAATPKAANMNRWKTSVQLYSLSVSQLRSARRRMVFVSTPPKPPSVHKYSYIRAPFNVIQYQRMIKNCVTVFFFVSFFNLCCVHVAET